MYKLELKVNGKSLKAEGETLLKALHSLKEPEQIKTAGVIKITCGKKRAERVLSIPKLRSLFNKTTDIYRIVMAKSLELFMK
jgi:phosphoribosylformylglycinamidine (FGAM) synthase PurS component